MCYKIMWVVEQQNDTERKVPTAVAWSTFKLHGWPKDTEQLISLHETALTFTVLT